MAASGPQFRTDVLTGQQVIVAPQRSDRPSAHPADLPLAQLYDPFAEGHEFETPHEHFAIRAGDSVVDGPGWLLRVVPNRYPLVVPRSHQFSVTDRTDNAALFPVRPAIGEHDVVIECPDPRSRMAELSQFEIQRTLTAWRTRINQLREAPSLRGITVFRNEGLSAGASLAHCHSQVVATTELTPLDLARHENVMQHRSVTGRDLVRDLWNAERAHGIRVICETSFFGVYCPFASRMSWQIRFQPLQSPPASFADASDQILSDLAALLKSAFTALESTMNGAFSFNLALSHPRIDEPAAFPWFVDLLPRTSRIAGWELLTSVDVVTVAPETAAVRIREVW